MSDLNMFLRLPVQEIKEQAISTKEKYEVKKKEAYEEFLDIFCTIQVKPKKGLFKSFSPKVDKKVSFNEAYDFHKEHTRYSHTTVVVSYEQLRFTKQIDILYDVINACDLSQDGFIFLENETIKLIEREP